MKNQNEELIKNVIEKKWEDHIQFLGDDFADSIIESSFEGKPVEEVIEKSVGGASFDWELSIKLIYETAQFLATVITIYQGILMLKNRKPTKEEVISKLNEENVLQSLDELEEEEAIEAMEETIGKLQDK